jgi:predicted NAD-dependent protein-ADP-ribosyltransferase YbiA (DUF1768 family)
LHLFGSGSSLPQFNAPSHYESNIPRTTPIVNTFQAPSDLKPIHITHIEVPDIHPPSQLNMPKNKPDRAKKPLPSSSSNAIFFYLPEEVPYGIFHQWHPSPIAIPTPSLAFLCTTATATTILAQHRSANSSIALTCAEQSHMLAKALLFDDTASCRRVLATPHPKEQKRLGQQAAGFNEWKWTQARVGCAGLRIGTSVLGRGVRE